MAQKFADTRDGQKEVVADATATYSTASLTVPAKGTASFTLKVVPPAGLPGVCGLHACIPGPCSVCICGQSLRTRNRPFHPEVEVNNFRVDIYIFCTENAAH